jgi:hypothetical protein
MVWKTDSEQSKGFALSIENGKKWKGEILLKGSL